MCLYFLIHYLNPNHLKRLFDVSANQRLQPLSNLVQRLVEFPFFSVRASSEILRKHIGSYNF